MKEYLKILIVEDNPGDVRIIQEIFKEIISMKAELIQVSTLADAQEKISKSNFDLVLLDLSLPDGYKLEGVKRICTMYPNIPVIVLTGLQDDQIAIDAIKIGAQDYMVKDQIDHCLLDKAIRYAIERKKMDLKFQHLASHDFLTNLPNRNCLMEQVDLSIERTNRRIEESENAKVVFILFDLNGFKSINDTYGHLIGDLLLIQIAERLKESVRMIDTVARLGGDEFGVLFEINDGELNTIFTIREKIDSIFDQPFNVNNIEILITNSMGLSIYPDDGQTFEELYMIADKDMYKTKKKKKQDHTINIKNRGNKLKK